MRGQAGQSFGGLWLRLLLLFRADKLAVLVMFDVGYVFLVHNSERTFKWLAILIGAFCNDIANIAALPI